MRWAEGGGTIILKTIHFMSIDHGSIMTAYHAKNDVIHLEVSTILDLLSSIAIFCRNEDESPKLSIKYRKPQRMQLYTRNV